MKNILRILVCSIFVLMMTTMTVFAAEKKKEDAVYSVKEQSDIKINFKQRKVSFVKAKAVNYHTVQLKWGTVNGADGYILYKCETKNGTYKKIATLGDGSKMNYMDKVSVCGKKYYYKVAAYRKYKGVNQLGTISNAAVGRTAPAKTVFTKKCVSKVNAVTLTWKKALGAKGYSIYRSTEKNSGFVKIKDITNADRLTWTDNLANKKGYYYKVRPYALDGKEKVYGKYSPVYASKNISKLFEDVKKHTNVKYVYGGKTTKGWDCSGFTSWAINHIYQVDIPSSSSEQATIGKKVNKNNRAKWQPGDILVYSCNGRVNHVALYLGDNMMMHAVNTKYDTVIQDVDQYEGWDKRNNLYSVRRCF